MNKLIFAFSLISLTVACGQADSGWTENQEIHFYNDCKNKMIDNGESEENAHAFCECCLLKVKDSYSSGQEAMQKLTDAEIAQIETDCSK